MARNQNRGGSASCSHLLDKIALSFVTPFPSSCIIINFILFFFFFFSSSFF